LPVQYAERADASIFLSVEQVGTTLRVGVEDTGPFFTSAPTERPAQDATSGRGLYLLTALADRWGVKRRDGNRAWFELELAAAPAPSPGVDQR
jgi:anti-sigma regulatory factor (Ser/Thr protein kinase)